VSMGRSCVGNEGGLRSGYAMVNDEWRRVCLMVHPSCFVVKHGDGMIDDEDQERNPHDTNNRRITTMQRPNQSRQQEGQGERRGPSSPGAASFLRWSNNLAG
jgi:hypothetical protein